VARSSNREIVTPDRESGVSLFQAHDSTAVMLSQMTDRITKLLLVVISLGVYAGVAPQSVDGLLQVNAQIPSNAPSGRVPIVLTIGSASSQPALTIAVRCLHPKQNPYNGL
jgi:hypothetical protein